ncbi:MAG: cysteine--tRNA ligase, partial [Chloroflexi bacterium]|nr:cysteine--tRNA ligase [Chloroflexota bacterium]
MGGLSLFNTLSGEKEPFSSPNNTVRMYVCGITPYAPSHIGHAMFSVVFDVVRRFLEFKGFVVNHVQNFTDIDDKMIAAAAEMGITIEELAERNIQQYLEEMDALNVKRAHEYPRATKEMPKIVEMIEGLIEKKYAYSVNGNVYFRVRSAEDYGKLSGRSFDEMMAGARVEVDEAKEDPMDFALWKSQKPGEPAWESPWGPGRPGWHIECSAMSLKYLGENLDIHGGGRDLIFPHHENEIAQTESFTDCEPFVRF